MIVPASTAMQPKQWHAAVVEDADDASKDAEARRAENIKALLNDKYVAVSELCVDAARLN